MAKRTRYGNRPRPAVKRAAKPGAPASGTAATPPQAAPSGPILHGDHFHDGDDLPVRSSAGLTEAEERRAAELEAEATARERAAIAESLRRRAKANAPEMPHLVGDVNAPLSVRAAHEYAYVARDVKRIALTASLMIAILATLYILTNVLGVIKL